MRRARPHWKARTFAPPPTTWLAAVRAPYVPPKGGAHVRAPRPGTPHCCGRPSAAGDPTHTRTHPFTICALGRARPTAVHAPRGVRAPMFAPHEALAPPVRAPRGVRAHGSRSRPITCAPLEYKFIKIVVHSTTWASRPSTTVRWMTARCLGGDRSFLIHSHGPRAHPWTRLYACLI
jgi:hypothetical protein